MRSSKILFQMYFVSGRIPDYLFHIFLFYITFSLSITQSSMIFQMLRGTWSQWSTLLLLLLGTRLLFVVAQCGSFAQDRQEKEDKQDKLALYKVTLRTYWSRARFPRHYPEWKPPAQFGKLIGESLNDIWNKSTPAFSTTGCVCYWLHKYSILWLFLTKLGYILFHKLFLRKFRTFYKEIDDEIRCNRKREYNQWNRNLKIE